MSAIDSSISADGSSMSADVSCMSAGSGSISITSSCMSAIDSFISADGSSMSADGSCMSEDDSFIKADDGFISPSCEGLTPLRGFLPSPVSVAKALQVLRINKAGHARLTSIRAGRMAGYNGQLFVKPGNRAARPLRCVAG